MQKAKWLSEEALEIAVKRETQRRLVITVQFTIIIIGVVAQGDSRLTVGLLRFETLYRRQ